VQCCSSIRLLAGIAGRSLEGVINGLYVEKTHNKSAQFDAATLRHWPQTLGE
jgi:hypothetical protein